MGVPRLPGTLHMGGVNKKSVYLPPPAPGTEINDRNGNSEGSLMLDVGSCLLYKYLAANSLFSLNKLKTPATSPPRGGTYGRATETSAPTPCIKYLRMRREAQRMASGPNRAPGR